MDELVAVADVLAVDVDGVALLSDEDGVAAEDRVHLDLMDDEGVVLFPDLDSLDDPRGAGGERGRDEHHRDAYQGAPHGALLSVRSLVSHTVIVFTCRRCSPALLKSPTCSHFAPLVESLSTMIWSKAMPFARAQEIAKSRNFGKLPPTWRSAA